MSSETHDTDTTGRATTLRWAAALGALGVAAGAFGAHGLEGRVTPERLDVWETAARYQLVHALALTGLAALSDHVANPSRTRALWCAGTVIFSGSLYALVASDVGVLGAITPFGGLALIGGWVSLGLSARRRR